MRGAVAHSKPKEKSRLGESTPKQRYKLATSAISIRVASLNRQPAATASIQPSWSISEPSSSFSNARVDSRES
jgi:hypothetical protein